MNRPKPEKNIFAERIARIFERGKNAGLSGNTLEDMWDQLMDIVPRKPDGSINLEPTGEKEK